MKGVIIFTRPDGCSVRIVRDQITTWFPSSGSSTGKTQINLQSGMQIVRETVEQVDKLYEESAA